MISLIKDALATYRITRVVVEDVIAAPMREKIFEKHPPHDKSWSYALTCYWCSSIYAGACVGLMRKFFPEVWDPISTGLAASAITGIMSERI